MNSLLNLMETICKAASVAEAAGVNVQDWQHHVQLSYFDEAIMSGPTNQGRLPLVLIHEADSSYTQTTVDGGDRETTFLIRIIGPAYRKRIVPTVQKLQDIKVAILAATKDTAVHTLNATASAVQTSPYFTFLDISLSSETTYDNDDYKE